MIGAWPVHRPKEVKEWMEEGSGTNKGRIKPQVLSFITGLVLQASSANRLLNGVFVRPNVKRERKNHRRFGYGCTKQIYRNLEDGGEVAL
jgi:hypothetical protein